MINILQIPLFKRQYKKLKSKQVAILVIEIKNIVDDPNLGEEKKGDLKGVFIHKFRVDKNLILLAYTWDAKTRNLLMLGTHENFYRDLKKYR